MDEWQRREFAEHGEKIAVLEAKQTQTDLIHRSILEKLDAIENEMTRYKGFLGGVAFLASGMAIAWEIGKDWLLQHFK